MSPRLQAGLPGLAVTLVTALGLTLLWRVTLGLQSYTWESHRRLQVSEQPVAMPALTLEDDAGRVFSSAELRGRVLLVNFIYTRCDTVCRASGDVYSRLQRRLDAPPYRGRVELLSISLDPAHDGPERLRAYRARYGERQGNGWRLARVVSPGEMSALLSAFAVVSIPDGYGGITHNAAVHLVDDRGYLRRIVDETGTGDIIRWLDDTLGAGHAQR